MRHAPNQASERLYQAGHRLFLLGLALKAINAAFELIVGTLLLVLPLETIRAWTQAAVDWVRSILHGAWEAHLVSALNSVTMATVIFIAWYFLSHGILKAFVIGCLMAKKFWAYPLGIVVFIGFGVYQTWEYFHGGAVFYLVLDVLDLALIGLTALEWRHAARSPIHSVDKGSLNPHS